jgi:hypothetical protein
LLRYAGMHERAQTDASVLRGNGQAPGRSEQLLIGRSMATQPLRPLFRIPPDNNGRVSRSKALQRWRKTVGAVIGTAIRDSDRKQVEVARAVGMSENVLSEIVQGHRKTEVGEIVLIAQAIDEDPMALLRRMLSWHSQSS